MSTLRSECVSRSSACPRYRWNAQLDNVLYRNSYRSTLYESCPGTRCIQSAGPLYFYTVLAWWRIRQSIPNVSTPRRLREQLSNTLWSAFRYRLIISRDCHPRSGQISHENVYKKMISYLTSFRNIFTSKVAVSLSILYHEIRFTFLRCVSVNRNIIYSNKRFILIVVADRCLLQTIGRLAQLAVRNKLSGFN